MEIGLRERNVVVVQEIEPKVRFLKLQGLYTLLSRDTGLWLDSA